MCYFIVEYTQLRLQSKSLLEAVGDMLQGGSFLYDFRYILICSIASVSFPGSQAVDDEIAAAAPDSADAFLTAKEEESSEKRGMYKPTNQFLICQRGRT